MQTLSQTQLFDHQEQQSQIYFVQTPKCKKYFGNSQKIAVELSNESLNPYNFIKNLPLFQQPAKEIFYKDDLRVIIQPKNMKNGLQNCGSIRAEFDDGYSIRGSGFILGTQNGKLWALSCAHLFTYYQEESDNFLFCKQASIFANRYKNQYSEVKIKKVYIQKEYFEEKKNIISGFDIALLELDISDMNESIIDYFSKNKIKFVIHKNLAKNTKVYAYGFPEQYPFIGEKLISTDGNYIQYEGGQNGIMISELDQLTRGQSGSPVLLQPIGEKYNKYKFLNQDKNEESIQICGVYIASSILENISTAITENTINWINNIIEDNS